MVLGLTGGIAAGKSTVARMFERLGAVVIDADRIAREVIESPEIRDRIRREWGEEFLDPEGRPDRRRIARRAFQDPASLRQLNSWVHPPTLREMERRLEQAAETGPPLIVIDAPLLLEKDLDRWCDTVVYVEAERSRRALRARAARGWEAEEIARREAAQLPETEKRQRADAVVDNNGSEEETFEQVRRLFATWTCAHGARHP